MSATDLQLLGSPGVRRWLGENNVSIGITTYQASRLFLVGQNPGNRLSVFHRHFERCMGLYADSDGRTLWMSSKFQIWRFADALEADQGYDGYDRVYIPRVGFTTGDLDAHDLAVDSDGDLIFVNTRFNCLAELNDRHSFRPIWRPPFISKLVPEDRCHLNGLALEGGRPRYVTAVSMSDVTDGWRDGRRDGGVVIDVPSGEVIASGLSMPHSPRFHAGKLWLLDSGTGRFGFVDIQTGMFEPVAFLPGFGRGLSFFGDYALIGVSQPRDAGTFGGLALDEELEKRHANPRCAVQIVDLRTGNVAHWLRFEGPVKELYDVVALPNTMRPMALGFANEQIETWLSVDSG